MLREVSQAKHPRASVLKKWEEEWQRQEPKDRLSDFDFRKADWKAPE